MVPALRAWWAAALIGLATGCAPTDAGPAPTHPGDAGWDALLDANRNSEADAAHVPGPEAAVFVPEHLGIGSSWYLYDGQTHALRPEPTVYVVHGNHLRATIEVISYYNERGESGFFTLRVASADPDAFTWEAARTLRLDQSVKEAPVCVDLREVRSVDCSAPHDLVARTDRRVVPAAGFAVLEPALHVVARTDPERDLPTVWSVDPDHVPAPYESPTAQHLRSALLNPSDSLLAPLRDAPEAYAAVQATTDMHLVQWRLLSMQVEGTVLHITMESRCAPLATTEAAQTTLAALPVRDTSLRVPLPSPNTLIRLDLCDDAGRPALLSGPIAQALWSTDALFDVALAQQDGAAVLFAAPGSLLHLPTVTPAASLPAPEVPASLWD